MLCFVFFQHDPLKKLEKKRENLSKFVLFIGGLTGLTTHRSQEKFDDIIPPTPL